MIQSKRDKRRLLSLPIAVALLLSACGGSETSTPSAPVAPAPGQAAPEAPAAPPFYEGKVVKVLIPTGPGGGQDVRAQYMASWWNKCLPGNPAIELDYRPGAGGIAAGNEFELVTPRDGMTILQTSLSMATNEFLGNDAIQFNRNDLVVSMVFPNSGAMVISPRTGLSTVKEVADSEGELIIGGNSPTASDLMAVTALEVLGLLGTKVRYVWGYESTGDHRLAFEQGETDLDAGPTTNYVGNILPLVEDGRATPFLIYGIPPAGGGARVSDPNLPGPSAPTVEEAHQELFGRAPSGTAYDVFLAVLDMFFGANTVALHKDDPQEAKDAMAEAVQCMFDGGFYEAYVDDLSPLGPIIDQDVIGPTQAALGGLPQVLRDYIMLFLRSEFPQQVQR